MIGGIAAGIVVFNAEKERLEKNISRLKKQVKDIYIFDNSDISDGDYDGVTYLSENKNCGIAYALNRIMEQAKADGYKWLITMDQDSLIPDGMVHGFEESIRTHENIGIVCPQVIDRRRTYLQAEDNEAEEYVNFCITSASCTSIEAWEKCGKFDEWMFIDLVDNDFCKRITLSGYKILKLNKWILDQEFGKITPKSEWKQQFWVGVSKIMHNQNFAKFSYKKSVSPLRVYYTNRNIIYVNKKLKKYGSVGYENYNCKGYIGFVISFMIPSILRGGKKIDVLKATVKGVKDGMAATPSEWSVKGKNMVE